MNAQIHRSPSANSCLIISRLNLSYNLTTLYLDPANSDIKTFKEISQCLEKNANQISQYLSGSKHFSAPAEGAKSARLEAMALAKYDDFRVDADRKSQSQSPTKFNCSSNQADVEYLKVFAASNFECGVFIGSDRGVQRVAALTFNQAHTLPPMFQYELPSGWSEEKKQLYKDTISQCVNSEGQTIFSYYKISH